MKNILLLSTVFLALSLPSHAQKPDKQARKASKSTAASTSSRDRSQLAALAAAVHSLTLTDPQRTKLEGITLKLEADILATLTPDQQAQFKEALEQAKKGKKEPASKSMFGELIESLQLTADQKVKVTPIFDQLQDKLTELQKSARANRSDPDARQDAANKSREVMTDARAKLRPLLTPDQLTRLDAWQPPKGKK
ncbi:hypothetical protein [Armatimonas rosea]|uniref:Spy/CpxP family protein refolding chaperone n=1 Tax=Armatimonas rosea TaxID=685828 RepID=A0A7W9W7K3_ARMRO|nr:hypothetical protein [Armatimonas rosea]MBB6050702.1 Spy/CpxP family protein refolding chaperone [Armatimonas rosea]